MRRRARILSALMFVALPLEAAPPAAAPGVVECARGTGPALGEIACEIARALGERGKRALVVALAPTGDGALAPKPELGSRLSELVAGALGREASGWPKVEPAERTFWLPWKTRPLVILRPHVEGDRVRVSADLYASYPRLWQRVRGEKLGPVAHGMSERGIDGEVRAYLPRIPLAATKVHRATGADADVVALACGDVDRDGSPEIAAIGRRRIALGRLQGSVFRPFVTRAFGDLAPVAPAPFREPIASAWVPEPGTLEVGTTDRARALRLDGKLSKLRDLDVRLPWPGGGGGLATAEIGESVDAIAGATLVSKTGEARRVRARRRPDGTVTLSDGKQSLDLEHAGAQLAVGDLDGDGDAELVTSLDTLDPATDALVVYSWQERKLVERLRIAAPGGVRALALCPPRATQMAPIAALVGDTLWVVE